ncbi:GTP cyclohydrolase II [bacterium]|nr:GTP cyclohydrolase II [bacterium]
MTELKRLSTTRLPTLWGPFQLSLFLEPTTGKEHVLLWMGDWAASGFAPLVRLHSECLTGDVFSSLRCDCGQQLDDAMSAIAREGRGAILYLRQEGRGIGLAAKLKAYDLQDNGLDTVEANLALGFAADERDFSVAAQMLIASGVSSVRLMTNNPAKIEALEKAGIKVLERIPVEPMIQTENSRYIRTKMQKMRHLISAEIANSCDTSSIGEG